MTTLHRFGLRLRRRLTTAMRDGRAGKHFGFFKTEGLLAQRIGGKVAYC